MLIYLAGTVLACFIAYVSQRSRYTHLHTHEYLHSTIRSVLLLAATAPLLLISSIRTDVGVDYPAYRQIFNEILIGGDSNIEPGFKLLVKFITEYTNNFQWIFFATAMITYFFLFKSLKKSVNPALSVYLFCNLSFFYYSLNTSRQFIAISIILLSLQYIIKRNSYKYLGMVFFASMFHLSSLLMLPMYYLLNIKYKLTQYFLIYISSFFFLLVRNYIIDLILYFYPQYGAKYIYAYTASPSEVFILTGVFLLALTNYLIKRRLINLDNSDIRVGLNIVFYGFLMHTVLNWIPLIDRATLYIDIGLIIFIPLLISKVPNSFTRLKIIMFLLFYTTIYTFTSVFINDSHSVLPFNSILFERISQ